MSRHHDRSQEQDPSAPQRRFQAADPADSVANVALSHGINANAVHKWRRLEPLDMRAGTESALARVVVVFGAARPHHAYLLANRMKGLVRDGIGVWLAARRLNSGKVVWPVSVASTPS